MAGSTQVGSDISYPEIVTKYKTLDPHLDEKKVREALEFTVVSHGEQKRASGDPYYWHPIEVAEILAEMKFDTASVITALLHDTVEDTDVTLADIEKKFGAEVKGLVDGVTKLTKIEYQPDYIRQAENFRKLLLAISEDIRVLLVKLADRLHNMRTLHFISSPEKRMRIAHETMEIYAPLAERIGMQKIKDELQNMAFSILHPDAYQSIISRLTFLRETGQVIVGKAEEQLKKTLAQHGLKDVAVKGREKTPYSIWRKMEKKNVSFEQLSDIMAFRVVVKDIPACYQALGIIHSNFHMVPEQFKDFISTPKENGYRSLHTVVMGVEKQRIEVQIRTKEMHDIAELGLAAHWAYKQERNYSTDGAEYKWIREMLYVMEHASGPEEYLENTKLAMYSDQVFCFTPKGAVIALPNSSTPVDFAYAVHSDVGNTCVGSKVNGRIVPLKHKLKNGDQVEIIRSKTHTPSPAWEKFVITAKAKSEVRKFVRTQQRNEYLTLGKNVLEKTFEHEGEKFNEKLLEPILKLFKKKTVDDLLAAVGEGLLAKNDILYAIYPEKRHAPQQKKKSLLAKLKMGKDPSKDEAQKPKQAKKNRMPVKGLIPGMSVHFAGCCHPVPGDKIVGIINTGKGVTIHTTECETLNDFLDTPERWVNVDWNNEDLDAQIYLARIKAVLSHETGALGTLANAVAKEMGNINNLKIINRAADFFEIIVDLEVMDLKHLAKIMATLRSEKCVYSVERDS